jgi:hypothetical protein
MMAFVPRTFQVAQEETSVRKVRFDLPRRCKQTTLFFDLTQTLFLSGLQSCSRDSANSSNGVPLMALLQAFFFTSSLINRWLGACGARIITCES